MNGAAPGQQVVCHRRSAPVLLVRNFFHPLDIFAVERFLNCDGSQCRLGRAECFSPGGLLPRTTRSVAPTQGGERLLRIIGPRFEEIEAELVLFATADLRQSLCLGFEKNGREIKLHLDAQMTFNNIALRVYAALAGLGLAFLAEDVVRQHLADGRLIRVLSDWCPKFSGYHLYYPAADKRPQPLPR